MTVASAANHLHLAPDSKPHQHLITQSLTGRMLLLTFNCVKALNTEIQNLSLVSCCCQQVYDILNMSCLQCRHAIRWGAMMACLHCRMVRLHTHSLTYHVGRVRLSDPDPDSQWIWVQIHLVNRMTWACLVWVRFTLDSNSLWIRIW